MPIASPVNRLMRTMVAEFRDALHGAREIAGRCVTDNLYDRHIKLLFVGA